MSIFACVHVCAPHTCLAHKEVRRGIRFPKSGVTDSFQLLLVCCKENFGPLNVLPCWALSLACGVAFDLHYFPGLCMYWLKKCLFWGEEVKHIIWNSWVIKIFLKKKYLFCYYPKIALKCLFFFKKKKFELNRWVKFLCFLANPDISVVWRRSSLAGMRNLFWKWFTTTQPP